MIKNITFRKVPNNFQAQFQNDSKYIIDSDKTPFHTNKSRSIDLLDKLNIKSF